MAELDSNLIQKLFHMGERCPADFERPAPAIVSVSHLADEQILAKFESLVKEIIEKDDGEVALLGVRVFRDLLKQYPQLKLDSPELHTRYQKLLGLLKFINLSANGGIPEIKELIASHLLDAIKAGIRVHEKFDWVLDVYDDMILEGTVAYELGRAMLLCSNRIGQQPLLIGKEKRQAPPTVGNWLIDYRSMIAVDKGGAYERISYLNQSENVRKLSPQDRELLKTVLKLYDWLRFGSPMEDDTQTRRTETPRGLTQTRVPDLHDRAKVVLPAPVKEIHSLPTKAPLTARPLVPSPRLSAFTEEIKREVTTKELPAFVKTTSFAEVASATKAESADKPSPQTQTTQTEHRQITTEVPGQHDRAKMVPKPPVVPSRPPQSVSSPRLSASLDDIKFVDDLKRIDVKHLREGELRSQISNIKYQISKLAAANHMYVHEVIAAFQQSPLFKAYIAHGSSKITQTSPPLSALSSSQQQSASLTQAEFEAVADLKKELERM